MSYTEFKARVSECAECRKTIGEDELSDSYLTVRDNNMIIKFFQFEDGEDNIFCDSDCLAKFLSAETIYFERNE